MTILETLLMYRIYPTWILFKHKATAELTHFPEKCWVFHASWFPKITTFGKLRSAMLWTSSTFSLPKSPEYNQRNTFKQSEKDNRRTITKKRVSSYVAYAQSEWQGYTDVGWDSRLSDCRQINGHAQNVPDICELWGISWKIGDQHAHMTFLN